MAKDKQIRGAIIGPEGVIWKSPGMGEFDADDPEQVFEEEFGPPAVFGPDGEARLGEWSRSLPIWVWGLLKAEPRTAEELARNLNCSLHSIYSVIYRLRRRGHRIYYRRGHYHLAEGPPLRVTWGRMGFQLAPLDPPPHLVVTEAIEIE